MYYIRMKKRKEKNFLMKHFAIQIYNYNNYKAKMIIQLYLDSFWT